MDTNNTAVPSFSDHAAAVAAGFRPIYAVAECSVPLPGGRYRLTETGEITVPVKLESCAIHGPHVAQFYPPAGNTLASKIVTAFLEPALAATDWREKWKGVNRAAGVITGWAISEFLDGHYQNGPLCYVGGVEAAEGAIVEIEALFNGDPARVQLTDGLRKRVAEILVLMS